MPNTPTVDQTASAQERPNAAAQLGENLPGGLAVWVFMTVELLTFSLFLLSHAWSWGDDPAGYAAAQALVHQGAGAFNTGVLLVASWAAARAVHANRDLDSERGATLGGRFWLMAAVLGLGFTGLKFMEYADLIGRGLTLSSHAFWFMYFFLTFLHLMHVLGGVVFAFWAAWQAKTGKLSPAHGAGGQHTAETLATYWHFVDLIWLLLFPTLYLAGGAS